MKLEHYLRLRTQDPKFLWRMVFAILGVGVVVGAAVQFVPPRISTDPSSIEDAIFTISQQEDRAKCVEDLVSQDAPFEYVLMALARIELEDGLDVTPVIDLVSREDQRRAIALQLMLSRAVGAPTSELEEMARQDPPVRYANHAIGVLYLIDGSADAAGRHFEIEGRVQDAGISRAFAIEAYRITRNTDALSRLRTLPEYESLITASEQFFIAKERRDWSTMIRIMPLMILDDFQRGFATVLAIVAGIGWFIVALKLGQFRESYGVRWWLCLLGVVMGGLSIGVTHLLIVWQELDWGITRSDELREGLKYYILGVGLREEFAKMVMLLPLMPLIVRRRNSTEALIVSACVGLGFAIVENMGYFAVGGGANSMARFLTANFAHMSMTGLIGLAIARACWSSQEIGNAVLVFLIVVLVHGIYDATIVLPALAEYNIAGMIVFILLSYRFFHEVRQGYRQKPETISVTATFLFVVCGLTALTFVYMSWRFGFSAATTLVVAEVISVGLMVYMYLREMPNSMIPR